MGGGGARDGTGEKDAEGSGRPGGALGICFFFLISSRPPWDSMNSWMNVAESLSLRRAIETPASSNRFLRSGSRFSTYADIFLLLNYIEIEGVIAVRNFNNGNY